MVKKETDPCEVCGLYKNVHSPKMEPTGKGKKEILIIAEAPGCFVPKTPIFGQNDVKFIDEVDENFILLDGTKPKKLFKYPVKNHPMVRITPINNLPFTCTEEHKIDTLIGGGVYEMIPANCIHPNDVVRIPKIETEVLTDVFITVNNKKIALDETLATLFGFYMGCGAFASNNRTKQLMFHLHDNKEYYNLIVDTVQNTFGLTVSGILKCNKSKLEMPGEKRSHMVFFSHGGLQSFFEDNFGYDFYERKVPDFILNSSNSIISAFLYGWLCSDIKNKKFTNELKAYTFSRKAAWQMYFLGMKLGWPLKIKDMSSKSKKNFLLTHPGYGSCNEDDNYFYVKINKIEKENYTGYVYDFETESHEYSIPFVVHNSTEDKKGYQLCGQSGKLLRRNLKEFGIDLDEDCWKTNALCCFPGKDHKIKTKEINSCRQRMLDTIDLYKPKKIILLGKTALQSFLGHRTTDLGPITGWTGWKIPDQETKCWVFPTYHPSYVLRTEGKGDEVPSYIFAENLQDAIEWDKPFPDNSYLHDIKIIKNVEEAISQLSLIKASCVGKLISFDYETTGIKPHADGHKIACVSISYMSNRELVSYSFPIFDNKRFHESLKSILTHEGIKKTAHNIKFENVWTRYILGYDVKGWCWDTMIATHCLDNRTGICSLKFQGYVNYGISGYDKEIKKYLVSSKKDKEQYGANAFNKVFDTTIDDLLKYCGMDSKIGYKLCKDQRKELRGFIKKGYNLFHEGILELAQIEANGFNVDEDYYKRKQIYLEKKTNRIDKRIKESKALELWKEKEEDDLNLKSPKQLGKLLFEYLGHESIKKTPGGADSTDKAVLEILSLKEPFIKDILDNKKLERIKDVLKGLLSESVDGKLRSSYNLHIAKTFRSSASAPNTQNLSAREGLATKITRSGIIPSSGNRILEADYGGIEVHVSGCVHKDPNFLNYLLDESTDMHRDQAIEIFKLEDEVDWKGEQGKIVRFHAKNSFVFRQFYDCGNSYPQCANDLWEIASKIKIDNGKTLLSHLKSKGIKNYYKFEEHLANIEDKFWNERFPVYYQWRKDQYKFFVRNGYIQLDTGFRATGAMDRNQASNIRIQGQSFHCLLWFLIEINKYLRENDYKTKIFGQIHDSLLFDIVPEEMEELIPIIKRISCEDIRKHWDWIIVPLKVEMEITPINGSWFEKEKLDG